MFLLLFYLLCCFASIFVQSNLPDDISPLVGPTLPTILIYDKFLLLLLLILTYTYLHRRLFYFFTCFNLFCSVSLNYPYDRMNESLFSAQGKFYKYKTTNQGDFFAAIPWVHVAARQSRGTISSTYSISMFKTQVHKPMGDDQLEVTSIFCIQYMLTLLLPFVLLGQNGPGLVWLFIKHMV